MNCLNGELFRCERMPTLWLTKVACGKRWYVSNTADDIRVTVHRSIDAKIIQNIYRDSPCNGCDTGRKNHGGEKIETFTRKRTTDNSKRSCVDCGASIVGTYPKTVLCRPCAKKRNLNSVKARYARKHPEMREPKSRKCTECGKEIVRGTGYRTKSGPTGQCSIECYRTCRKKETRRAAKGEK